jgi:hypothetical protein
MHSSSAPCVLHVCPSHPPWLNHSKYIWRRVQGIKPLTTKSPPASYYFIPLRSEHSTQHPVLKYPQSMLFPQCKRPSFTPMQNYRQHYSFLGKFWFLSFHTADEKTKSSELNNSFIHQWFYSPLLSPGLFFSFVIFFTQTVEHLGRVISPSQGRYLHTGQHKHRINAHTDIHALSWELNSSKHYLNLILISSWIKFRFVTAS